MATMTKARTAGWWNTQLKAGEKYREKYSKQTSWNRWRSYYRGNWTPGILPVNLFFTMVRTVVPRIYFRNPGISVSPAKPGAVVAAFSQILERADNKLIRRLGVKKQIKKMIRDSFMFGTGVGKLGFGAEFATGIEPFGITEQPYVGRKRARVEYQANIIPNCPWFLRIHPGDFIVPSGAEDSDNLLWAAHEVERPLEDVKQDPRLKGTDDLGPDIKQYTTTGKDKLDIMQPTDMIRLYEIHDIKYQKVIVIAPSKGEILYQGDDELQLGGSSYYPLIFNDDDLVFWGVPESVILEPQQLELNEIRTQAMKHRRVSLVKLLVKTGAITETEAKKMVSEDVLPVVWTNEDPKGAVFPLQVSDVPSDLMYAGREVMSDVRETVGFSRNEFGEYAAGSRGRGSVPPTATETRVVKAASSIRVDERRDMVADLIGEVVRDWHELMFTYWEKEQVMDIIGPGGVPLWVSFTGQMLRQGRYETFVDPDTSLPVTREARESKAMQVYGVFKENPLIDPQKLTRYLLHEMHGVMYDDLMRGLPQGAGQQGQPLNMGQYTKLLGNAGRMGLEQPGQTVGAE